MPGSVSSHSSASCSSVHLRRRRPRSWRRCCGWKWKARIRTPSATTVQTDAKESEKEPKLDKTGSIEEEVKYIYICNKEKRGIKNTLLNIGRSIGILLAASFASLYVFFMVSVALIIFLRSTIG